MLAWVLTCTLAWVLMLARLLNLLVQVLLLGIYIYIVVQVLIGTYIHRVLVIIVAWFAGTCIGNEVRECPGL